METLDALKRLAVALGAAAKVSDVTGATVAEVIDFIAVHLPKTAEKPKSK